MNMYISNLVKHIFNYHYGICKNNIMSAREITGAIY